MVYVMPPQLLNGELVAPWRLRLWARVPAGLVEGEPAAGKLRLVVEDQVVVEEEVEPVRVGDAYELSFERFYERVEWPQTVKQATQEAVYTDVSQLRVGVCTEFTTVYAFAPEPAVVRVGPVIETSDRDGDGIIEAVYMFRPGDEASVECRPACTVRVWRTPCVAKLRARVEAELLDAEGNVLAKHAQPIETYEAVDWRPAGVTIEVAGVGLLPNPPWCREELEEPAVQLPRVEAQGTTIGFLKLVDLESYPPPDWHHLAHGLIHTGFSYYADYPMMCYTIGETSYDCAAPSDAKTVMCRPPKLPKRFLVLEAPAGIYLLFDKHIVPSRITSEEDLTFADQLFIVDTGEGKSLAELGSESVEVEPYTYIEVNTVTTVLTVNGVPVDTVSLGARSPAGWSFVLHLGSKLYFARVRIPVYYKWSPRGNQPLFTNYGFDYAVLDLKGGERVVLTASVDYETPLTYIPSLDIRVFRLSRVGELATYV